MKYWPPEPPATLPGLRFTTSTQRLSLDPCTGASNRSGHSQTPEVAPAGPNLLSRVQSLRLLEPEKESWCSVGSKTVKIQRLVGSYKRPLGSQKSFKPRSRTGFFEY